MQAEYLVTVIRVSVLQSGSLGSVVAIIANSGISDTNCGFDFVTIVTHER